MKTSNSSQFLTQLKRSLSPIYLIAGDEPLQQQEAIAQILQVANQQDFTQRQSFTWQSSGFDWQQVYDEVDNLSLFAEKKIIHLRLKKINKEAQNFLKHYLSNTDTLLIISCDKLDASAKKSQWLKSIDQQGSIFETYPIRTSDFPQWLKSRLQQAGLSIDNDALQYLAARTEGNLLAAKQEIDKLSLLFPQAQLCLDDLRQAISDHARFDVFDLTDAIMLSDRARVINIMQHLQAEAVEATIVLWALARELRLLIAFLEQGDGAVWSSKKILYRRRCQDFSLRRLYQLLERAHYIDTIIKGINKANSWDELTRLAIALCQKKKPLS